MAGNNFNVGGKFVISSQEAMTLPKLSAAPVSPVTGDLFFNTTLNEVQIYRSGSWQNVAIGSVSLSGQPLNSDEIIVGNVSNLSTAVNTSTVGDILAHSVNGLTLKALVITNASVSLTANIDLSKLAVTTIDRALVSNSSGVISPSSVTSVELGYLSGVTGALQTQLNTKVTSIQAQDDIGAIVANSSKISLTYITNTSIIADIIANSLVDADINASAAIAYSKLAVLTVGKALQSNVTTGFIEASTVTNTELGYLSSVTSSIQTQLNSKLNLAGGTLSGPLTFNFQGIHRILGSDPSPFREGSWFTASGDMYTLLGDFAMFYWTHNVNVDGSGNFLGRDDTGTCTLWVFTESDLIETYSAPSNTAGTVPVFTKTSSQNTITGVLTCPITGHASLDLALTGGTMSGAIAMGNSKITGLAAGTTTGDAVRYEQVILVSGANAFSANQSMGGFKITSLANGTANGDAVNYSQLTAATAGFIPVNPIADTNVVDDTLTTPPTGVTGETYLAGSGSGGGWTDGHLYTYNGASWVDVLSRAVIFGDRFGVTFSVGTAAGGLATKHNQIATITTATPGSYAYSFSGTPTNNELVRVNGVASLDYNHTYVYSTSLTQWVEIAVSQNITPGAALSAAGTTWNVNYDNTTINLTGNSLQIKAAGITNSHINASAAIAYSKLALTGAILNADLAGSIAYSKLSLSNSIVAGDLTAGSVSPTKLSVITDGITLDQLGTSSTLEVKALGITNSHISATAAIAYSKLALTGAVLNADLAGSIAYSKLSLSNSIVNADIAVAAAIAVNKLAALSLSAAVVTNGSGFLDSSVTTSAEIAFVSGVTSAIQTQLNTITSNSVNTTLSNLGTTSINASLLPNVDNTISLGSTGARYIDGFFDNSIKIGSTALQTVVTKPTTVALGINVVVFTDIITLFSATSQKSTEILYEVTDGADVRSGKIMVSTNNVTVGWSNSSVETGPISSLEFQVYLSAGNAVLQYKGTGASICTLKVVQISII